ncbi:MAG: peptidoglycan DD-metalloendopeptidase family protein [Ktedonobacteraceae bacterium]
MVSSFPRTRSARIRRHVSWTLALLAAVGLATGPAVLAANADDLKHKKNQVHKNVKAAQGDLEESSAATVRAANQLKAAQVGLASAQQRLAKTQGELTAAQVLDTRMQAQLVAAQAALTQAVAAVAAGKAKVAEQRAQIGQLAASSYSYGDPNLMRMAVLLKGTTPEELAVQLSTVDSLMSRESAMLDDLKSAQSLLVVQKRKVAEGKAEVAEKRQAAAVNLARKKALEQQAATNRAQVAALVGARQKAVAAASAARAADARKLAQLKQQEARIQKLILARAKSHKGKGFSGDAGTFLLPPVANSYITSPYGYRVHPIYGYYSLHDGDDFHAPCGVPERASAGGTVISEYYSDVWGNRLYLDLGRVNGKSMVLIYNHISSYKAHTGDRVRRGDTVAYAGTTGWSTACHLHFTVMVNGKAVDPQKFM